MNFIVCHTCKKVVAGNDSLFAMVPVRYGIPSKTQTYTGARVCSQACADKANEPPPTPPDEEIVDQ